MSSPHDMLGILEVVLARPADAVDARLNEALRMLCKYRSEQLTDALMRAGRPSVQAGPFAGMALLPQAAEGCYVPKILGVYEQELHGIVEQIIATDYEVVINVGCAEGYYAVGLARRMPQLQIDAFDIADKAQRACRQLAADNGVSERVAVAGQFEPRHFADYAGRRTCILCDIEGAEIQLLDPQQTPALADCDVLLEVHDDLVAGCGDIMRQRFSATHHIEAIEQGPRIAPGSQQFMGMQQLDRLLAVWEWRQQGNRWMWLTSKRGAHGAADPAGAQAAAARA